MKELSIFVDESGDFDLNSIHSPYYLFTIVMHDQSNCVDDYVSDLNYILSFEQIGEHAIHTAPLIRQEERYRHLNIEERRKLFFMMKSFMDKCVKNCNISHQTFLFEKRNHDNAMSLNGKMAEELSFFIIENNSYFNSYNHIIVYYDNGQDEITRLLNSVLKVYFGDRVEFRKVLPVDFKLFQVADYVCTMELVNYKRNKQELSNSEKKFFRSQREIKDIYKSIKQCKRG